MPFYPDPRSVPGGRLLPPGRFCRLTDRRPGRTYPIHDHRGWIDANLNGETSVDASHAHAIRDGYVQPDSRDGHTHLLTRLECS